MGAPGTTEGPWSVAHSTISWWIEAPTDMSGQIAGGALPADTWHMNKEERQRCRAMSDAHQIAASGALYDALSTAVEALESFRAGSDYYPGFPAWEADARAALALARGETPSDTLGEKA